jgi:hypothetical protein
VELQPVSCEVRNQSASGILFTSLVLNTRDKGRSSTVPSSGVYVRDKTRTDSATHVTHVGHGFIPGGCKCETQLHSSPPPFMPSISSLIKMSKFVLQRAGDSESNFPGKHIRRRHLISRGQCRQRTDHIRT